MDEIQSALLAPSFWVLFIHLFIRSFVHFQSAPHCNYFRVVFEKLWPMNHNARTMIFNISPARLLLLTNRWIDSHFLQYLWKMQWRHFETSLFQQEAGSVQKHLTSLSCHRYLISQCCHSNSIEIFLLCMMLFPEKNKLNRIKHTNLTIYWSVWCTIYIWQNKLPTRHK